MIQRRGPGRRAEDFEAAALREKVHRQSMQMVGLLAVIVVWAVYTLWMFDRVSAEVLRMWDDQSNANQVMQQRLRGLEDRLQ